MTSYGQFCPVAKTMEIIGERWTLLILRELLSGATRFGDIQRGLRKMSPTILAKRLKHLEEKGLVVRKRVPGQMGYEYRLTRAGRDLEPMVEQAAIWGMRWARGRMTNDELDVELLMSDVRRRVRADQLPDGETVVCFTFRDLDKFKTWWLMVDRESTDLCTDDHGKDVDIYITTDLRTMTEIWEGDLELSAAMKDERLSAVGAGHLVRSLSDWLGFSRYRHIRPGTDEERFDAK